MIDNIRIFIARFLWKYERISRNYCWADAVTTALGYGWSMHRANHKCFYCLGCNTDQEVDDYQSGVTQIDTDAGRGESLEPIDFVLAVIGVRK